MLIHSIPTVPFEVGTVWRQETEHRDRRSFGNSSSAGRAGIEAPAGQEHTEVICIYLLPPLGRQEVDDVRELPGAILDPLQSRYRATHVNIHC